MSEEKKQDRYNALMYPSQSEARETKMMALSAVLSDVSREFPLAVLADPSSVGVMILTWRGVPIGPLAGIEISAGPSGTRVSIRKGVYSGALLQESEERRKAWYEMAAAGIQIEEKS